MKNLIPYPDNCFDVHTKAVNAKNKGERKTRLQNIGLIIEEEYKIYSALFKKNELNSLVSNSELNEKIIQSDLLSLYGFQSNTIKILREKIRNLQPSTIRITCQNCTIDTVGTLDHVLPKTAYPGFSVNPLNLFPCCSKCNSYKLDSISSTTNQKFLNLYLDELPEEQYLFVNVFLDNFEEVNFNFFLKNLESKIGARLFQVICNHYKNLHLLNRMKLMAIEFISELENKIIAFCEQLALNDILKILISSSESNRKAYGYNHWKYILEFSLLTSPVFLERIEKIIASR